MNKAARRRLGSGAILPAFGFLLACGSSSQTTTAPAQVRCTMSAQVEAANFPADGGSGVVRITAARECTWSAQSEASWLVLTSGPNGQGDGEVAFRVASNDTPESRNTAIAVNENRQQISQAGRPCRFDLSSDHEVVAAAGGERTIEVKASSGQCRWTTSASAPWIAIVDGREGRGNGRVRFTVAPATGPPRTATLTVAQETVRIDQGTGCTFAVSPANISVTAAGGDHLVRVEASGADCPWSAASNVAWLSTVGTSTGNGSGTVTIRATATNGPPRTGTMVVAGHTVVVEQGTGCTVDVNPASTDVPAQGGTVSIALEAGAGCSWTAVADQTWIGVVAGGAGIGSGRVDVSVAPNSGPARAGSVSIGGRVVAISQASGCTYAVSPAAQNIQGGGTSGALSVTTAAGCPWTAESHANWIAPSTPSGVGPADLRFTVSANDSPARTGTMTVAGQVFTVNQDSMCTYTMSPPFHEFGDQGGSGNVLVIVSGPCTWTAASQADWIQVTAGSSGRGNGLVQFAVPSNAGSPRTGFVVIAGRQYRVSQAGR